MTATLEKHTTEIITAVSDTTYTQERPLFGARDTRLENVSFLPPGESALKETHNIEAVHCTFAGKYPLWHNTGSQIKNCVFEDGGRAAVWYSKDIHMSDTLVKAPKMFREADGVLLENVQLPNALECLWNCRNVTLKNVTVEKGDYLLINGKNIQAEGFKLQGNYAFQYVKNAEIRHAEIYSKDAFWNSENVTVYDSAITGEYLGWHSKNLRLVNCTISGTQPLCYATDLILENCTLAANADLCFEYSTLRAEIDGNVPSVKNPRGGYILADGYGAVILDEYVKAPADCQIKQRNQ